MQLRPTGQRVLGCLVEKALATPQQYPLTRNALRNACNQSTGRDPVVDWDEGEVRDGIADLKDHDLVGSGYTSGSRVPKYHHRLDDLLGLGTAEQAVLALLLLRGPQTIGELRNRSDRLHAFDTLEDVEVTLSALADHRFGALAESLPRQPGQKEVRWTHLLGDPATAPDAPPPAPDADAPLAAPATTADLDHRVEELETRVEALEDALAEVLAATNPANE